MLCCWKRCGGKWLSHKSQGFGDMDKVCGKVVAVKLSNEGIASVQFCGGLKMK